MRFFARVWTTVTTVTHWLILSPVDEYGLYGGVQQPIGSIPPAPTQKPIVSKPPARFRPPGSNLRTFECDYVTNMGPDWYDCTKEYAGCWIKNAKTGYAYDIKKDYENIMPIGVTRQIVLSVTDGNKINVDGMDFTEAKLFNGTFPGPLLEACWGDTLNVTVHNNMKWNGTSVHWHGIRQNQTMEMDGVNGITQCPIAPGQSFTYTWKASQYGSSWYHSHYSVQYADGLQGPITLHGPTSVDYDEAVVPLITSDWLHNTAFVAELNQNASFPTILLNGTGNCKRFFNASSPPVGFPSCSNPPASFHYDFSNATTTAGGRKRYLLRIINTSYSTELIFSIDNHTMTVVEADFVPTLPSNPVTSINLAIGQRYHVVVEALAKPFDIEPNGNFWIRTNTSLCNGPDDIKLGQTGGERTGIIRYNPSSQLDPTSQAQPGNQPAAQDRCVDSLTTTLKPVIDWTVTPPKNGISGEAFDIRFSGPNPYGQAFVAFKPMNGPNTGAYYPFQTTWGNPTFLNLDNDDNTWPNGWMVIPENYQDNDFVYLVIQGQGSHPIHLHGHDFVVVDYNNTPGATWDSSFRFTKTYTGLMRRDVMLTPPNGYVVIAFKTDNPGNWLMHCHIAFHASGGLSLQILERRAKASEMFPAGRSPAIKRARQVCQKWNNWEYDCTNQWPGAQSSAVIFTTTVSKTATVSTTTTTYWPACTNGLEFQNDSGI